MFLSPSTQLSHGWVWRGSTIHMLLWLEPPFICWENAESTCYHKLAIWRLENSISRSWFKYLGIAWLERKDFEAFCPLMSITFRGHYRFLWPCALWTAQLENTSSSYFLANFCQLHTSILIWSIGRFPVQQPCPCCNVNILSIMKGHLLLSHLFH